MQTQEYGTLKREHIYGSPVLTLTVGILISAAFGILFFVVPEFCYQYCGYYIGAAPILAGLVAMIGYFARRNISGEYRYGLCAGIAAILLGAYLAFGGILLSDSGHSATFADSIGLLGLFIGADGLIRLQYAIDLSRMTFRKWWIILVAAIVGLVIGTACTMGLVYNAGVAAGKAISTGLDDFHNGMMMLGIALCLNGFLGIVVMILIAVRNHRAKKAPAELPEAEESPAFVPDHSDAAGIDDFGEPLPARPQFMDVTPMQSEDSPSDAVAEKQVNNEDS